MERPFGRGAQPQVLWTYLPWLLPTYKSCDDSASKNPPKTQRLIDPINFPKNFTLASAFGKDVRDWLSSAKDSLATGGVDLDPKKEVGSLLMLQTSCTSLMCKNSFDQSQDFSHQEYLFDFPETSPSLTEAPNRKSPLQVAS